MLNFAKKILPLSIAVLAAPVFVMAESFNECPEGAFLVQDNKAKIYGVNLATGHYEVLVNPIETDGQLNAIGFNVHDQYLYGWDYVNGTLSRIHSDFSIEPLSLTNKPGRNFYIGDASLENNTYYVYNRSNSSGLYAISLDETSDDYLEMKLVVSGRDLKLTIFDIAFHPTDTFAYTVDRNGFLHQIDVSAGSSINLGYVGSDEERQDLKGTYGAVYFDSDGNFYISRNHDGSIFRIDVSAAEPKAQYFAQGPSSGLNDGARCAQAAVEVPPSIELDFGDAPASYGTLQDDGENGTGASHQITGNDLFLGAARDAESDAYPYPLSDDETGENDDDGIQFVTSLITNELSFIEVTSSDAGKLSAWIDADQNGTFDEGEAIFQSVAVSQGQNYLTFTLGDDVLAGDTWMRFRLTTADGVQATGGAPDGEVEDYPVSVILGDVVESDFYPSKDGFVTLVYEDNWPEKGDYDLNDLVVYYRTEEVHVNEEVESVRIAGDVAAMGAAYQSGFAIRLKGIDPNNIDVDNLSLMINDLPVDTSEDGVEILESDRSEAILVISQDMSKRTYSEQQDPCFFYRTVRDCPMPMSLHFELKVPFIVSVPNDEMPAPPYDPFMFATPGAPRGDNFLQAPGRGLEIHLQGQGVTEAFDDTLWNTADDASDPDNDKWFVTEQGMPWAFELQTQWKYPVEFVDVIWAYPGFVSFVESGGTENLDWYSPLKAWEPNIYAH